MNAKLHVQVACLNLNLILLIFSMSIGVVVKSFLFHIPA